MLPCHAKAPFKRLTCTSERKQMGQRRFVSDNETNGSDEQAPLLASVIAEVRTSALGDYRRFAWHISRSQRWRKSGRRNVHDYGPLIRVFPSEMDLPLRPTERVGVSARRHVRSGSGAPRPNGRN